MVSKERDQLVSETEECMPDDVDIPYAKREPHRASVLWPELFELDNMLQQDSSKSLDCSDFESDDSSEKIPVQENTESTEGTEENNQTLVGLLKGQLDVSNNSKPLKLNRTSSDPNCRKRFSDRKRRSKAKRTSNSETSLKNATYDGKSQKEKASRRLRTDLRRDLMSKSDHIPRDRIDHGPRDRARRSTGTRNSSSRKRDSGNRRGHSEHQKKSTQVHVSSVVDDSSGDEFAEEDADNKSNEKKSEKKGDVQPRQTRRSETSKLNRSRSRSRGRMKRHSHQSHSHQNQRRLDGGPLSNSFNNSSAGNDSNRKSPTRRSPRPIRRTRSSKTSREGRSTLHSMVVNNSPSNKRSLVTTEKRISNTSPNTPKSVLDPRMVELERQIGEMRDEVLRLKLEPRNSTQSTQSNSQGEDTATISSESTDGEAAKGDSGFQKYFKLNKLTGEIKKASRITEDINITGRMGQLFTSSSFAHDFVNETRKLQGLDPLHRSSKMDKVAQAQAELMAKTNGKQSKTVAYKGHVLRGSSIEAILEAAMSKDSGAAAQANILDPTFKEFGTGSAKGSEGVMYLCQLFAGGFELGVIDTR